MVFPNLKRSNRDREYLSYSPTIRAKVVYAYLFDGDSHRAIDKNVIGIDSNESRGFLSMNILHFLGLRNEHKGFFKNSNISSAISYLEEQDKTELSEIIDYLSSLDSKNLPSIDSIKQELSSRIKKSQADSSNIRKQRLKLKKRRKPEKVMVSTFVFKRDADVIVEVLERANGVCEFCNTKAPFLRKKDNQPYLEVHHKIRLADGGEDTIENAVALCPNCHRKAHFG